MTAETTSRAPDEIALPQIARGRAGSCCIRCGRVGLNLAADHGCLTPSGSDGFDAKHARDFLDLVLGPIATGTISVCAIDKRWKALVKHAYFPWIHQAVEQAATWERQYKPEGIYFRVTALPTEGPTPGTDGKVGRGGAADSRAINCMWADLDFGSVGHAPPANGPRLPADADEALTLIEGMPKISVLVHSGGGLYPIWLFRQPVYLTDDNRDQLASMAERWQRRINRNAARRGLHYGQGVGNLDRLLRLPGSINRKAGLERRCRVVRATGEVHDPWA